MPDRRRICLLLDDEPEWCRVLPDWARLLAKIPRDGVIVATSLTQARAALRRAGWPVASDLDLAFVCADLRLADGEWGWDLLANSPFAGRPGAAGRVILHSGFLDLLWTEPSRAAAFADATLVVKGQLDADVAVSNRMRALWTDDGRI